MLVEEKPILSSEQRGILKNVPLVSVDLVVEHDGGVFLGKRENEPANDTEAVVAELAPSQTETLGEGAVVEVAGEGVTVAVGGPESDVSALASVSDTVWERSDWTIYYPSEEDDS